LLETDDETPAKSGHRDAGTAMGCATKQMTGMTDPPSQTQILLARIAVALIVGLAAAGVLWYGVSTEVLTRIWRSLLARPGGPMTFRFLLQPAMAGLAAWRDGVADARLDRTPYLSTVLFRADRRGSRIWEGVLSTSKILILGAVMDVIYQALVLGEFYPGEAAIVAVLLAFVPYALLRGPIGRVARLWMARRRRG
jgi:TRAP-type C4-dicarboxylate transport system permease large subunit